MPGQIANDPNLDLIRINDFSPGIIQYGTAAYPVTYSTTAPVGSASFAARCINRPGVGLIPFFNYTLPTFVTLSAGNSPSGHPFTLFVTTGMGSIGGVGNQTTYGEVLSQTAKYSDYVANTICGLDSIGNIYSYGYRWFSSNGTTPLNTQGTLWSNIATNIAGAPTEPYRITGVSFDVTSVIFGLQRPVIIMGHPVSNTISANAGVLCAPLDGTEMQSVPFTGIHSGAMGAWAHSSRVFVTTSTNDFIGALNPISIEFDDSVAFSDPPTTPGGAATPSFINQLEPFALENSSGFGAWGSVSTGELILIRRGQGGMVIQGDAGFPTSVTKLPAVQGTGGILQRMSMCEAGAVYATESAGVWAWNGGNTAIKISGQIPDNATIRAELQPGGATSLGSYGARAWHDVLGGLVFFANNWVFDSANNSWWQSEDPAVVTFSQYTTSKSTTRLIYASVAEIQPGGNLPVYMFDNTTVQDNWVWNSNPIPAPPVGGLPTLAEVEICASNPANTASTITVVPSVPKGSVDVFNNNAQTLTFTIPANVSGYRQNQRCGFQGYNICVNITGSNPTTGPTLHELNLGFRQSRIGGLA